MLLESKSLFIMQCILVIALSSSCAYQGRKGEFDLSNRRQAWAHDWRAPTLEYTIEKAKSGDPVAAYSLSEYYGRKLLDVPSSQYWSSVASKNGSFENWRDKWNSLKDNDGFCDRLRASHYRREAAKRGCVLAIFDGRRSELEKRFGVPFVARFSPDPLFGDRSVSDSDMPSLRILMSEADTTRDAFLAHLIGGYFYKLNAPREAVTWFTTAHAWGAMESSFSLFRLHEMDKTLIEKENLKQMLMSSTKQGSYYAAKALAQLMGGKPDILLITDTEP